MSGMHRDRVETKDRPGLHERFRLLIQLASAALVNGYAAGFAGCKIFTGTSKMVCLPVLNCYSCPGALGACPIGSLQAVEGGAKHNISFYVLGTLMLFGVLFGRLICGFLCPFGLVQDLLGRIPARKLHVPEKIDKPLRYLKYVILAVLVILLPMLAVNQFGIAPPYFCKYICPAGTLEGGIPHLLMNESLRKTAGALWNWKLGILILVILGSVFVPRFFCRYLCPLGSFYSLFNRFSLFRMDLDKSKCVDCKSCENVCPMAVKVTEHINSPECIRCGKCKAVCPVDAISSRFETDMLTRNVAVKKVD
jgi:polyferredoxin